MQFTFSVVETDSETVVLFPEGLGGGWVKLTKSKTGKEHPKTAVKAVLYGDDRLQMDGGWGKHAFKRHFGPVPEMPLDSKFTEISVPAEQLFAFANTEIAEKVPGSSWGATGAWMD